MADYRATSKIESWRAMDKTDLAVSEVESNFFAGEDGQISLIHGTRRVL
jgi:hypothetical protein